MQLSDVHFFLLDHVHRVVYRTVFLPGLKQHSGHSVESHANQEILSLSGLIHLLKAGDCVFMLLSTNPEERPKPTMCSSLQTHFSFFFQSLRQWAFNSLFLIEKVNLLKTGHVYKRRYLKKVKQLWALYFRAAITQSEVNNVFAWALFSVVD